ncbi:MAG: radical SAM protein, partial [Candidatus Aenigmarchaeota archaeon]|nr:radical SAM protein [Candidatus Aenigmarchaeota archaeon]
KKLRKAISGTKVLLNVNKFIDEDKKPKELDIGKLITSAIIGGSYDSFSEFHRKSLFIGMMHFMDLYNYDIDRVQKCCIHYATPDGRVIPFCAFNVIPQVFRDKTQKEFSISSVEWEKKNNKKISNDKYIRKIDAEKKKEIDAFYNKFRQNITK